ncbi:PEP-CTERM sorting domain-containing protein [Marinobacter bohaiensis]|uniref:PEP-CTERM sorting domain-containing protein n=1 Tax=Marinobacter bohaiensis TaxID=2201898 RepID=UPI000DAC3988|nr:PEP-CTERM sorting domain-containing protein [Marinobacter bohaiensis]
MSRLFAILLLVLAQPAVATVMQYDYRFHYKDISLCPPDCSAPTGLGSGSLLLDTDTGELSHLLLVSDDFAVDWWGSALFTQRDGRSVDGGELASYGVDISPASGQSIGLYLDLFFVPDGGQPLAYLENVVEEANGFQQGETNWFFWGQYSVSRVATVPEPGALALFGLGLTAISLVVGLRRRSRSCSS